YDLVLWLDADTVVLSFDRDPVDDLPAECFQGLVQHARGDALIPNTGAWLVTSLRDAFETSSSPRAATSSYRTRASGCYGPSPAPSSSSTRCGTRMSSS